MNSLLTAVRAGSYELAAVLHPHNIIVWQLFYAISSSLSAACPLGNGGEGDMNRFSSVAVLYGLLWAMPTSCAFATGAADSIGTSNDATVTDNSSGEKAMADNPLTAHSIADKTGLHDITTSAAVAKPLKAAQTAIDSKNWRAAHAAIDRASVVSSKTEKDQLVIDTLMGYVQVQQHDYVRAAKTYERLVASPLFPADQLAAQQLTIAKLYFRVGMYSNAAQWAEKYTDSASASKLAIDASASEILGESYFHLKKFKTAMHAMRDAITRAKSEQRAPKEAWLRIVDNSAFQVGDEVARRSALTDLVRYYGKSNDWRQLIALSEGDRPSLGADNVLDDAVQYELKRFEFDMDVLRSAREYEGLVFDALDAHAPEEALKVLERARDRKVFDTADSLPGTYERLHMLVDKDLQAAQVRFDHLVAGDVQDGAALDLIGRMYLNRGQYGKAVESLRQALAAGGVHDANRSRMSLGIALLNAGDRTEASKMFASIAPDSKWADVAELWTLRAQSKVQSAEARNAISRDS